MKSKSVSLVGASITMLIGGALLYVLPPNAVMSEVFVEYAPEVDVPNEELANVPIEVVEVEKIIEEVPVEMIPTSIAVTPPTPHKKKAFLDVSWLEGMSGGVGAKTMRDGSKDYRGIVGKTIELPVNWDRKLLQRRRKSHRRFRVCPTINCLVTETYGRR